MREFYLFGSARTGEVDSGSDVDLLVINEDGQRVGYPTSWSVYSARRVQELFSRGMLFAWHLHREAFQIFSDTGANFLESLGPPAPYAPNAIVEIESLSRITCEALDELADGTPSWVYERGLVYVGLRDIGMAAALVLDGAPNFSKHAPFALGAVGPPPLSVERYDQLMNCRRACTRDQFLVPVEEASRLSAAELSGIRDWCNDVLERVRGAA